MRFFLIRHGESLGDLNPDIYQEITPHKVPLSEFGYEQSVEAGQFIKEYYDAHPELTDKKIRIWHSPFLRAEQTTAGLEEGIGKDKIDTIREDHLLREQDFGLYSMVTDKQERKEKFPLASKLYEESINADGRIYPIMPLGESGIAVADRMRLFTNSLMLDVNRGHEDHLIVSHGMTIPALEMGFLHLGVDWLEKQPKPGNCDITLIEGNHAEGYTTTKIYEGKVRLPSLPKDYKTLPFGGAIFAKR